MTHSESDPQADALLSAARTIRRADSVADIASNVLRAVLNDAPRDSVEWRLRSVVRTAIECGLRRLELLLVQRMISSPEMASDLRGEFSRQLQRALNTVNHDTELTAHVAQLAVSAVTRMATASDSMQRAINEGGNDDPRRPYAFATVDGRLFIPTSAREFARAHGLHESELNDVLMHVTRPLRRACESDDVCRVGELRFTKRLDQVGLNVRAQLDTSMDVHAAPLIRIQLTDTQIQPEAQAPRSVPEPSTERYSARLLRQLIS